MSKRRSRTRQARPTLPLRRRYPTSSVLDILAPAPRRPAPPPGQIHRDKKKDAQRLACRRNKGRRFAE